MGDLFHILLRNIGDVASVIGFLISAYVLFELIIIKRKFLFKARIPDLIKSLKNHTMEMSQRLNAFDGSKRELETDLTRCGATLKNLKSKVDRNTRQITKQLIKRIQKRNKPPQKEEMWQIYNDLQALIDSLGHLQKDSKWG